MSRRLVRGERSSADDHPGHDGGVEAGHDDAGAAGELGNEDGGGERHSVPAPRKAAIPDNWDSDA